MTSFPLYVLLSFILFPSALPFFLFLFLVSFTFFWLFKLPFRLFIMSVSLRKTLCQKIFIFSDCRKTLFFCLLFFHQNLSFPCFPFLLGLFQTNLFSMFCLSVSWKMVSHFCVSLLFWSFVSSLFLFVYCPFFDVSKNKKLFLMEMMEKLSFFFWFCSLGFWKRENVCAKKSVVFSIIFETVWILFSLHFKAFIFCFVQSLFSFTFFLLTFFPFFTLSSLSSLFAFSFHIFVHFFCFSLLFLFSLFSILSLSISLFLFLTPLYLMFSLSLFSPSPFWCILFLF